jgi:hypothetical protein
VGRRLSQLLKGFRVDKVMSGFSGRKKGEFLLSVTVFGLVFSLPERLLHLNVVLRRRCREDGASLIL